MSDSMDDSSGGAFGSAASSLNSLFEGENVYLVDDCKCSLKGIADDKLLSSLLKERGATIAESSDTCNVVVISPEHEVSIDSFEGKKIFGQKYVEECIEKNKPFEKAVLPYPLLSHALEGVTVACDVGLILKPGVCLHLSNNHSRKKNVLLRERLIRW